MRTSRLSLVIAAIVMSWGAVATVHAQLPAKPPELRALERFAGTWDYEVTTRAAVWTPRAAQSRGTATTQWTMGFLPAVNVVGFASRWDESTRTFKGTTDLGNGVTRTYLDISGTNRRRR